MSYYLSDSKNKYYTLYSRIREDILRGKFKSGEKLASKRELARECGVSVVTVQLAYEQLLAEGYIYSRERSGYFVEKITTPPDIGQKTQYVLRKTEEKSYKIDFVKGAVPSELFPFSVWAKLMRVTLADWGERLLERVPYDGDPQLKEEIANYLYRSRGVDADPRNIIVGAGAEYLYGVIVQLLGRDKLYAVENPGYGKISSAYALNGAKYVAVNVKSAGVSVDDLNESGADVLHISPSHQFPTGVVTPISTRLKLIEWASCGRYIVEDDYDSEFRLSGKPLQSLYGLCPDRVIYLNTFSKSLAPSMRMGYMVLPDALLDKFTSAFSSGANVVPLFEQKTLAAMLRGGYFERHIQRLRSYYRNLRAEVIRALKKLSPDCRIIDTGSGLHMLARFPSAKNDDEIKRFAAAAGVNVRCLSDYLLAPMDGVEKYAVINYSGVTAAQLAETGANK